MKDMLECALRELPQTKRLSDSVRLARQNSRE